MLNIMNSNSEIEKKLIGVVDHLHKEEFIYDLLLAYGISKTSITRLKKGDYNLSKVEGEVLYKNKIFFKVEQKGKLLSTIDTFSKEERILKHNPRFIVITDFETIVARDMKLGNNRDFPIKELPNYYDFFLPLSGAEIYKASNDNKADRDAAYQMAQLYDTLVTDNPEYQHHSHKLNLFLSRLLFCFFAEDTDIFSTKSVFTNTLAQQTEADGSDVAAFLSRLFHKLNTKEGKFPAFLAAFPYVNGGLFREDIVCPRFSTKSRKILLAGGNLDWSEINPDIFGSMIQAVADPEERSDLGMHYTSVPNIKKLIQPLFLDELYEAFEKNFDNIAGLRKQLQRMSKIKFFDPACGSGNFLIITYKEIRLLEIKILQQLIHLEDTPLFSASMYATSISLNQFYGIEIKDFAHEMARLSLWLAEHQMNKVFDEMLDGYGKSAPILPLKEAGHITCGNAARIDWESVCPKEKEDEIYVIGNPPYLGARMQDEHQKSDMDFVFQTLKKYRDLDYISIWFYKAKKYIECFNAKYAFVSTNSVCQGQQVALLWPNILNNGIEIAFAHLSFKWTNNARGNAGVTVIVLGLRNKNAQPKFIYTDKIRRDVKNINAYLLESEDIFIYEKMVPVSKFPKMNFGNMPNDGGGLILSEKEKQELLTQNPAFQKFIRKLLGSYEFLNGEIRYCLWIEDKDLEEAIKVPFIKNRIEITKEHRLNSKDKGTQKLASRAHQFRDRNVAKESQIIIPAVSSERRDYIPIGILDTETVISNSAMAIYDAQPWLFGVLHSKMHMVWVNTVGGKLKTDYRYSAKLCYNTFPFPDITVTQKETINQYVYPILDERAQYPEKTMAWLYNPKTMPAGLKQAHHELDLAVERLYRLAPFESDTERLAFLFKLYEEMVQKDTLFAKEKKTRKKKVK